MPPDAAWFEDGPDRRPSRIRILIALLSLLGAFRLVFPGDVPFINDEPLLIQGALDANARGTLVSAGLLGTRGIRYGPVPTWFYQVSLAVTPSPILVATVRTILVTGLTALALVMLARSVDGLSPLLGAFAFLSPYLWFYSRDLWDNSFSVPFSAMLLAAYAQFWRGDRLRWLALAAVFGTLCFMTHPMTMPLVGAVGLHFAVTRWRAVIVSRRLALGVLGVGAFCFVLSLPYLGELAGASRPGFGITRRPASIAFGLNGIRLFSLSGFDYFIGPWLTNGFGLGARLTGLFSYVAAAYGLVLTVRAVGRGDSTQKQLASVLLLALAFFLLLANGSGLREHPHYYSGIWIVFFCIWWIGMSRLVQQSWARRVFGAQVTVMAVFLLGAASWIHWNEGTRTLRYGATLENQMAVARELDRLGAEVAPGSTALGPRLFPHAIGVLRTLHRRSVGGATFAPSPRTAVQIVYAEPDGSSGELMVRLAPSP